MKHQVRVRKPTTKTLKVARWLARLRVITTYGAGSEKLHIHPRALAQCIPAAIKLRPELAKKAKLVMNLRAYNKVA